MSYSEFRVNTSYHCVKVPVFRVFWSVFSRIWTEYREILRISPYSVRMRENTGQKNSEYGNFTQCIFINKTTISYNLIHLVYLANIYLFKHKRRVWKMLKANNKVNKMMLLIELEALVHLHADTNQADTDIFKTSSGCLKQVTTS